jgi:subtilisin family serine protease
MAFLWVVLGNRVVLAAPMRNDNDCDFAGQSVKGIRVPAAHCRRKNEYLGMKVAVGLTVAGAIALVAANFDVGTPAESGFASDDDLNPHFPNRSVGAVDEEHLNAVLSNPSYIRQYGGYSNFDEYNEIGLAYSLARGFSGFGAAVAVLDTGVAGTFAAPNPNYSSRNQTWHGTAVANLIKTVAPDSEIIAHRVSDDGGKFQSYFEIAGHIAAAAERADVINNSWGIPTVIGDFKNIDAGDIGGRNDLIKLVGRDFLDSVAAAARDKDVIFVWAAGNEGGAQSNAISAIPLFYSDFQTSDGFENFINVVAWDTESGTIADYSNHCGVTKSYCLTAPGTDLVLEIFKKGDLEIPADYLNSGTSFAAPLVSGAAAAIKSAYPFMTGGEITKLLFITARDLGRVGVDEVYGWGMLDLEAASRPVGTISIGNASFGTANISGDSMVGNAVARANLGAVFTDSFGRGFNAKLNDYISFSKKPKSLDALKKFGAKKSGEVRGRNLKNPFFLNNSGAGIESERRFDFGNFSLGFDFVYQKYDFEINPLEESKSNSISMLTSLRFDTVELSFGVMGETGAILQSRISGEWLGVGENSATAMFGFRKDIAIADDISAIVRANFGATVPEAADNSIISNVSAIYTSAFSAALNFGKFSFFISRPLKVDVGYIDLTLPISQNDDGTLNYARQKLSLRDNPAMEYGFDYEYENMSFGALYADGEFMLLFRIKSAI